VPGNDSLPYILASNGVAYWYHPNASKTKPLRANELHQFYDCFPEALEQHCSIVEENDPSFKAERLVTENQIRAELGMSTI